MIEEGLVRIHRKRIPDSNTSPIGQTPPKASKPPKKYPDQGL